MSLTTYITVRYTGVRQEESASEYISSTDGVRGIDPAEIYEQGHPGVTTRQLMAISESVFARDWDRPEEDEAWAYLSKGK